MTSREHVKHSGSGGRTTGLDAVERIFDLSVGEFRGLDWSGGPTTAVFLHGLSGMADVWHPTIDTIAEAAAEARKDHRPHPRCVAIDQRGHGRSPHTPGHYGALDYVGDLMDLVEELGGPVHLVGHSMGARVAMIAAARHPSSFISVVIVDIGPEAWQGNISATTRLLEARPERFADREEALSVARFIVGDRGEDAARTMVDDRLRRMEDGSYTWLSPRDALVESVTVQRSQNYWHDWDRITVPALLVRGGQSDELRPHVVERMRRRNPAVGFVEIEGVGHNIPMLAPQALGQVISSFWRSCSPESDAR